jgi:cell wall-associated NlpC family hydrolase
VRILTVHSTFRVVVVAITAALTVVFLSGLPAKADPTIQEVEAQLNQLWNQLEPLIEKYNAVHDQYLKNKARVAALQKQIAPLQTQLELAQVKIGVMAAQAYKGGTSTPMTALLTSGSPDAFVDQLTYVDMLARSQVNELATVREARDKYNAQKAPLDALVEKLAKQDSDLAQQRKTITQKLSDMQKLRVKVYGTSGGIGQYRPWTCPSTYLPTKGYKAAAFACRQAGKPYVWGAAGPNSYDCSGLTMAAWATVGVYLPHNAYAQAHSMTLVSRTNLQIGDLVFYYWDIHHVTIYVGNGHVMSAPQPGDVVRMMDIGGAVWGYGHPG